MKRVLIVSMITLFLVSWLSSNQRSYAKKAEEKNSGAARFAQELPDFSLADPDGIKHTKKSVLKNGVVLVVTAPILSQSDEQEDWAKLLADSRSGAKAQLIFLEDMQPSNFKGVARSKMKQQFKPGQALLILLDEKGKLRRALKVTEEDTVVLVYDKHGTLIHAESGKPSAERASAVWKKSNETE
jgi:hypothetical protein